MKTIKGLILGSTAALLRCWRSSGSRSSRQGQSGRIRKHLHASYGAGFYYIPGTDTCIKIGGAIRLDTSFNANAYDTLFWQGGAGGAGFRVHEGLLHHPLERINLTTDTRTATEYGVVRTLRHNIQFDFSQNRESIAGGFTEVDYALIQFAGFTFGVAAVSQFDPQWALMKPVHLVGLPRRFEQHHRYPADRLHRFTVR